MTIFRAIIPLPLLLAGAVAGCAVPDIPVLDAASPSQVDSILPLDEEIRRFRAGTARTPDLLAPMIESREELIERFVTALEAGDTLALDSLSLSRAEFAYLYYPTSQYIDEPYRMSPALLWFMIGENSYKGISRAVGRRGGQTLDYAGHRCDPEPVREGENRLWTGCVLFTSAASGASPLETTGERFFGSIIERAGRFKFVSYANAF